MPGPVLIEMFECGGQNLCFHESFGMMLVVFVLAHAMVWIVANLMPDGKSIYPDRIDSVSERKIGHIIAIMLLKNKHLPSFSIDFSRP